MAVFLPPVIHGVHSRLGAAPSSTAQFRNVSHHGPLDRQSMHYVLVFVHRSLLSLGRLDQGICDAGPT